MLKIARLMMLVVAVFALACGNREATRLSQNELVDLTYEFSDQTIYWVTAEPFRRRTVAEGVTDKGFYYSAYDLSAAEHGGTHIDSPVHFAEGRKTVEQIGLEQLVGEGIKIDVSKKADAERDYQITIDDITQWEAANGPIPDESIILFQTGFGSRWPDKKAYLGTDQTGPNAVKDLHFPGLHADAAKWLIKNRKFKAVGIDTASIDHGQSSLFESHVVLMTKRHTRV